MKFSFLEVSQKEFYAEYNASILVHELNRCVEEK